MSENPKHKYIVTMEVEPKKDGDCVDLSCLMLSLTKDVKEIKVRGINVQKIFEGKD